MGEGGGYILKFSFIDQFIEPRGSTATKRRQRNGGQTIAVTAAGVGATTAPYDPCDYASDE